MSTATGRATRPAPAPDHNDNCTVLVGGTRRRAHSMFEGQSARRQNPIGQEYSTDDTTHTFSVRLQHGRPHNRLDVTTSQPAPDNNDQHTSRRPHTVLDDGT